MAIVKWRKPFQPMWPSIFDEDIFSSWPELSSDSGLNIFETDDDVVVQASVPGIPDEEVEVTVEGNVLTISGRHEESQEEKDKKKVVYKSNMQSSFNYSTSLPRMVDSEKASADVDNGVVTVTIPKLEAEKPRKITVNKKK